MAVRVNGSSAPGTEGILPSVLKTFSEAVAWPLYFIFRNSLDTDVPQKKSRSALFNYGHTSSQQWAVGL